MTNIIQSNYAGSAVWLDGRLTLAVKFRLQLPTQAGLKPVLRVHTVLVHQDYAVVLHLDTAVSNLLCKATGCSFLSCSHSSGAFPVENEVSAILACVVCFRSAVTCTSIGCTERSGPTYAFPSERERIILLGISKNYFSVSIIFHRWSLNF